MLRTNFLPLFLPLALALTAGASSALADCGDWLAHHEAAGEFAYRQARQAAPTTPFSGPRQCNGPQCRRAPQPLPGVPQSRVIVVQKLDVALHSLGDLRSPHGSHPFLIAPSDLLFASGLHLPPERPPRV